MPTRRKEASPKTLALVKKGKNVKMDDDVDRIDVYNQYDEENIEIDEEPVSIHLFYQWRRDIQHNDTQQNDTYHISVI